MSNLPKHLTAIGMIVLVALVLGATIPTAALAAHRQPITGRDDGAIIEKCQPFANLAPPRATPLHIAILGDSVAEGYGTSTPLRCGFAFQLPMQLPMPIRLAYQTVLTVNAGGGMRVDQMAAAASVVAQQQPDLAVIELGTNDERENTDIAVTQSNYDAILQTISTASGTTLAHPIITCLSIWPSPGFDDPALLHAYDDVIQAECQKFGGVYSDITNIYAQRDTTGVAAPSQNWHPNDYGALLIARQIVMDVQAQHRLDALA